MSFVASFFRFISPVLVAGILSIFCGMMVLGCAKSGGRSGGAPISPGNPLPSPVPPAPQADDHGGDAGSATILTPGTAVTGEIEEPYDRDMFAVWVQGGQTVTFSADSTSSIELWVQENGNWTNSAHGTTASVQATPTSDGYIYFYVENYSFTNTPAYSVVASLSGNSTGFNAQALLVNTVMDWNNPSNPTRDTTPTELLGVYKMVALMDETALRSFVLNTSRPLDFVTINVWNNKTGQSVSRTLYGPATRFEFRASSLLELGYCAAATDELAIQVITDSSQLDGQDVTASVERISVSIGSGSEEDMLNNLPPAVTVRYREHSRLQHTAIMPRRVDERSTDTVFAEVELANTSAIHTASVSEINFIDNGNNTGVSNLRLVIDGQTVNLTGSGIIRADLSMSPVELSPGEVTSYRVLADTIASVNTNVWIQANGVSTTVDHGSQDLTIYEGGARDAYGNFVWFGVEFNKVLTMTQRVITTTGPFNGRDVFAADLMSSEDVNIRGAVYTLVSNNAQLVGEVHLVFDGTSKASTQENVNKLVELPFGWQTTSFELISGVSYSFNVPLHLNTNQSGDTVQMVLHAILDDWGRAHMVRQTGPSHLVQ